MPYRQKEQQYAGGIISIAFLAAADALASSPARTEYETGKTQLMNCRAWHGGPAKMTWTSHGLGYGCRSRKCCSFPAAAGRRSFTGSQLVTLTPPASERCNKRSRVRVGWVGAE